ncbi:hypothetical protein NE237_032882 [Protea cynaroides]|uniref:Uncharacterized protein n=1 Tax=Protea cynaroides TaxID=273540 RepID=A0A9Q0R3I6_9MAGN|nr:hypothetical protein NE237_032882 [Protea cynaroides]
MTPKKKTINLIAIKQKADELLRAFLTRFNNEVFEIKYLDPAIIYTVLMFGISDPELLKSVYKKNPANLTKLRARCEKVPLPLVSMLAVDVRRLRCKADNGKGVKAIPLSESMVKRSESAPTSFAGDFKSFPIRVRNWHELATKPPACSGNGCNLQRK